MLLHALNKTVASLAVDRAEVEADIGDFTGKNTEEDDSALEYFTFEEKQIQGTTNAACPFCVCFRFNNTDPENLQKESDQCAVSIETASVILWPQDNGIHKVRCDTVFD